MVTTNRVLLLLLFCAYEIQCFLNLDEKSTVFLAHTFDDKSKDTVATATVKEAQQAFIELEGYGQLFIDIESSLKTGVTEHVCSFSGHTICVLWNLDRPLYNENEVFKVSYRAKQYVPFGVLETRLVGGDFIELETKHTPSVQLGAGVRNLNLLVKFNDWHDLHKINRDNGRIQFYAFASLSGHASLEGRLQ
jgi:hypothetical protein